MIYVKFEKMQVYDMLFMEITYGNLCFNKQWNI